MLSIGAVAVGSGAYYVAGVAEGLEDYYLPEGDREAPGEWTGRGALGLGLTGQVERQAFLDLLANRHPDTGERLRARPGTRGAYDLTFSAPKSVSLIYAYGSEAERLAVTEAHTNAVKAATAWLEVECGAVRTGAQSAVRVDGNGWAVGLFLHRTSREGDPQLHTHAVVANAVQATGDGKWRTIDSAAIYASATTAGALYQVQLRYELTQSLGVSWQQPNKNLAEIDGAPPHVLAEFSRRSQQLQEAVGRDAGKRSREAAILETRRSKGDAPRVEEPVMAERDARDYGVPPGRVQEWWAKRADDLGLDTRELVDDMVGTPRTPEPLDTSGIAEFVAEDLTAQHASFTRRDVIRNLTNRARDGASVSDILGATERVTSHPEFVRLDPSRAPAATMERRDGGRIRVDRPEPMTTKTQLAKERLIETTTRRRLTDNAGIARAREVEFAIDGRTLGADQAHVVRELTTSGRGVEMVIGAAGSGKTYTLGAAAEAWDASGFRVLGTAHASVAAEQLGEALPSKPGQPAPRTIDSLLFAVEGGRERLDRKTVLIVDEAEMAGTDRLARLMSACDARGTKLVLVGDPGQLPAIDNGGMLRSLQTRFSSTTLGLETNRRQQAEWERKAIDHLRNGRTGPFLDAYRSEGRIAFHETAEQRTRAIAVKTVNDYEAGRSALVLTGTNENVDALNGAVQQRRQQLGQLGDHVGRTARGEALHEGDRLMLLRNDRAADVRNGQVVTVLGREQNGRLRVERQNGRRGSLEPDYVIQHSRLGYASTTHKAQGATADVCHYAADNMTSKELAYVATTRGKAANVFHLTAAPTAEAQAKALDRLEWDLRRSVAKTAAIDEGAPLPRQERQLVGAVTGGPPGPPIPTMPERRPPPTQPAAHRPPVTTPGVTGQRPTQRPSDGPSREPARPEPSAPPGQRRSEPPRSPAPAQPSLKDAQVVRAWMAEHPEHDLRDANDVVSFVAKRENASRLPEGMTARDVARCAPTLHAMLEAEDRAAEITRSRQRVDPAPEPMPRQEPTFRSL